jgi:uncharacterized protein (UPF0335 family)
MPRARKDHTSNGIDSDRLKSLDERFTRLEEELKAIQEGMKDILTEMKSAGYDIKLYKKAVKIRNIGYDEFRREGDELDLYLHALEVIPAREPEPAY